MSPLHRVVYAAACCVRIGLAIVYGPKVGPSDYHSVTRSPE